MLKETIIKEHNKYLQVFVRSISHDLMVLLVLCSLGKTRIQLVWD